MFSFLFSAGNKIKETFQGFGHLDRSDDEIKKFNAKYIPGLELQLTSEVLQKYKYDTIISTGHEIGILYNLKYGGLGARVLWKSSPPITQLTCTLRLLGDIYGFTSMGVLDFDRSYKLDKWGVGVNLFARKQSAQIKLDADKLVISTRHGLYPGVVTLSEANIVLENLSFKSTFALGIEWELHSRSTLQLMFSQHHSPTFALQYQSSSPPCLVKFYGDLFYNRTYAYGYVFDNRIGASVSFHPSSFF